MFELLSHGAAHQLGFALREREKRVWDADRLRHADGRFFAKGGNLPP
jgi:hypothetical protein